MGSCQNYGPFLGTLKNRCRIIIIAQKRDHNFDNHPYVVVLPRAPIHSTGTDRRNEAMAEPGSMRWLLQVRAQGSSARYGF